MVQGARALGFWLGKPEIFLEPEAFSQRVADSLAGQLRELSARLYAGPPPDLREPVGRYLDTPADELLLSLAGKLGEKPRPFWPEGAPYAVCLTHDVDRITYRYHAGLAALRQGKLLKATGLISGLQSLEVDPFFNLERIARQESSWGLRSAIYILFERRRWWLALGKGELQHVLGVYDPGQIKIELRKLDDLGFEIGLHGSLEAHANPRALGSELERLGELLGQPQRRFGVRNHYLQFDWRLTPSLQMDAGVLYDATAGFNFTCGFSSGTTFPFAAGWRSQAPPLVELPLGIMDTALSYAAPGHEREVAERLASEVRRRGGLLVINWHQRFSNPATGPFMHAWVQKVTKRARRDRAWLALPRQVAAFWRNRLAAIV